MNVLLVEDEPDFAAALQRTLREEGFGCHWVGDGELGLQQVLSGDYDAVVLDIMLPKRNGLDVLAAMRRRGVRTPVMILTARDAVDDRVRGLNEGADDYLPKPFALDEFLARLRALIRRGFNQPCPIVRVRNIALDRRSRHVTRDDTPIHLTPKEFDLLELLALRQGEVVDRKRLYACLDSDGDVSENALDVYVCALRRKLGRSLIQTKRGVGYIIQ